MEIPFKKELWNEHEAVLLIEIQKKIQEGAVSRIQAVSYLSERLRNRMILDGITISDRYRNIAGIDLQLNTVERYISNGSKGFGPVSTSKIFEKVILLQTEDNVAYTNLLEEAELLYPEVKLVKKGKTKFDWDEFEAVLLVNLYKQLLNGILCQEEACRLLKERLGNGSSVVNRTICVSNSDLNEALDDIEHYEKGVIQSINEELKKAIELSKIGRAHV